MSTGYGWEGIRQVCATPLGARHVPERLCGGSVYLGRYNKCSTFTFTVRDANANVIIIKVHTVVTHGINVRRSRGAVDQRSKTVDGTVPDSDMEARLTVTICGVRRRTCLQQSSYDVATISQHTQV